MDITKKIGDLSTYIKEVTEILWRYIHNIDLYPKNVLLAVQPELMETVIDTREACSKCEFYALSQLIYKDSKGRMAPNRTAIEKMAGKYYPNSQ